MMLWEVCNTYETLGSNVMACPSCRPELVRCDNVLVVDTFGAVTATVFCWETSRFSTAWYFGCRLGLILAYNQWPVILRSANGRYASSTLVLFANESSGSSGSQASEDMLAIVDVGGPCTQW